MRVVKRMHLDKFGFEKNKEREMQQDMKKEKKIVACTCSIPFYFLWLLDSMLPKKLYPLYIFSFSSTFGFVN